jgi:hypothetical protein
MRVTSTSKNGLWKKAHLIADIEEDDRGNIHKYKITDTGLKKDIHSFRYYYTIPNGPRVFKYMECLMYSVYLDQIPHRHGVILEILGAEIVGVALGAGWP